MRKNIKGVKFWQIGADEANGEEYFGESDDRSSVVSRYLRVLVGELCIIHQIPKNFLHPIFSHAR